MPDTITRFEVPDLKAHARRLADLSHVLESLDDSVDAIRSVQALVQDLTHAQAKLAEQQGEGNAYDPCYVYWQGYKAISAIVSVATKQATDAFDRCEKALKGDPAVRAELQQIHDATPLGPMWTGEQYPES